MTRSCFFVSEVSQDSGEFDLPQPLSRQLDSVLRVRAGETIELLDGRGGAWECLITAIRRGSVRVRVIAKLDEPARESRLSVTLGVGVARPDTMDLIVRQATELGVERLAVFRAARSQYGPAEKKKERWGKIASEAVCQCGRRVAPEIILFEDLAHFLTGCEADPAGGSLRIFAREREPGAGPKNLAERWKDAAISRVTAVLGPEGGWESPECSALIDAGFEPVSLGPRILRMETAVVALISSVQLLWGDMGEGLSGG